ncbi:chemotaxis protein CheW [Clostridium homopropionicum DSM 5847]|uniref:Chemotaxis protein CheW n=1 Tax=Clostridium homopropionicum DSM 5847 TaxID=1121318 RepID=A0A0L6Z5C3_9CLOT|nr:chemotaxis protein CheW [Clostridium homopropionicum]KOA18157.1 chemotaxis protein CheW [Clostridium homopropionicum DSM 5847]SFG94843.1 purine-binding chemotaxis protein CheW [Clostridium homopropionicum]
MEDNLLGYMEEDTQKDKFLIFSIDKEQYGIEIKYVLEIIGIQKITEVPELPDYVKGVINLRGKIIPVMDVRLRFKKNFRDYDDRTCIIVVQIKDMSIGLIIDRVIEVVDIEEEQITPPPELNKSSNNKYIKGIGKIGEEVKLLIDCDKLLSQEEVDEISY